MRRPGRPVAIRAVDVRDRTLPRVYLDAIRCRCFLDFDRLEMKIRVWSDFYFDAGNFLKRAL